MSRYAGASRTTALSARLHLVILASGLLSLLWLVVSSQAALPAQAGAVTAVTGGTGARPLTSGAQMDGFGAWSPDGTQISFMRSGQIWLMSADGAGARRLTHSQSAWETISAWRPDGAALALVRLSMDGGEAQVVSRDLTTDRERVLTRAEGQIGHLAWAPDGKHLYFTNARELIRLDPATGRTASVYAVEPGWDLLAGGLAISPDGRAAVFGAGPVGQRGARYDLWRVPLTSPSGEPERLTTGGGIMPAYDPAGERLVYRNPRQQSGVYVMMLKSHTVDLIVADSAGAMYFHPALAPDGKLLLLSRLVLDTPDSKRPGGSRFTSHLYLHTLTPSGGK